MLRSALAGLLAREGFALQQVAGFATGGSQIVTKAVKPQDYSLVMHKAAEIGKLSSSGPPPGEGEVGVTSGAPMDIYERTARIFVSSKVAGQSGLGRTLNNTNVAPQWKIAFATTAKWENPLMGYTSTGDTLENVARASLFFYTKEQAIEFCKKHGWKYSVDEPNPRRATRQKRWASYGDNFSVKRKGLPDLSHLPSNRSQQ